MGSRTRTASANVRTFLLAAGLVLLSGALADRTLGAARPYWTYSYGGIDVMTPEDGAHARAWAHNVHRVEVAVQVLLGADSTIPLPPTHIYSLHHPTYVKLAPPDQYVGTYSLRLYVPFEFVVRDGENYALMAPASPTSPPEPTSASQEASWRARRSAIQRGTQPDSCV